MGGIKRIPINTKIKAITNGIEVPKYCWSPNIIVENLKFSIFSFIGPITLLSFTINRIEAPLKAKAKKDNNISIIPKKTQLI